MNIAFLVASAVFFWLDRITHEEMISFMVTVTAVVTSMIGYFTKDEDKNNNDRDRPSDDGAVM